MSASINDSVRIKLDSGNTLVGIISQVSEEDRSILLTSGYWRYPNEFIEYFKKYSIPISAIKSIEPVDTISVSSLVDIKPPSKQVPLGSNARKNPQKSANSFKYEDVILRLSDPASTSRIETPKIGASQNSSPDMEAHSEPEDEDGSPSMPSALLFGNSTKRQQRKLKKIVEFSTYDDFIKNRCKSVKPIPEEYQDQLIRKYKEKLMDLQQQYKCVEQTHKEYNEQDYQQANTSPQRSSRETSADNIEIMEYCDINGAQEKSTPGTVDIHATTAVLESLRLSSTPLSSSRQSSDSSDTSAVSSPKTHTQKNSHPHGPSSADQPFRQSQRSLGASPAPAFSRNTRTGRPPVETKEPPTGRNEMTIKTVAGGISCPIITPKEMNAVEKMCEAKLGPNKSMMIENAGYAASVMALKAIGGHRRIQPNNHNSAPLIVILAGNNTVGCYSFAAARHLANRGCQVVVLFASSKKSAWIENAFKQIYEYYDMEIINNIDQLPQKFTNPVDLIIDGLMGCQSTMRDLRGDNTTRELLRGSMDWANANKAPILSLDFPSGVNGMDGNPFHVMHHIKPKWTLCFGAPKIGCTSRSVTGELFLADIGIPPVAWEEVAGESYNIPWGPSFLLALEYGQL
ncbi:YjeF N-terminal domain-containing protein [Phycomyces nitens]|nr:YjeF N-terminal domain-containing protein [Phycomyces nitens]